MERESARDVVSRYAKLMAGLMLVLFNFWHLAREQVAKQNSDRIEALSSEFSALKTTLEKGMLRREKAKTDFELLLEHRNALKIVNK